MDADFVSNSSAIYIVKEWWDPTRNVGKNHVLNLTTEPSPDMIEMPVWFKASGPEARAQFGTGNVVNALVDNETIFMAKQFGPIIHIPGSNPNSPPEDIFEYYTRQAAIKVGFSDQKIFFIDDRVLHGRGGSIHCATNVLREVPDGAARWWLNLPSSHTNP